MAESAISEYPLAACVVVSNLKGKLLAVSRRNDPTDCGLPGGKCEPNETCAQAAARELFEETGLKAKNLEFVFGDICKGQKTFWVATYTADVDNPDELRASEEGAVQWVEPSRLTEGVFGEYNKKLFDTLGISY